MSQLNTNDACVWYLVNIMLDSSVGMFVVWLLLSSIEKFAIKYNWPRLKMGNYSQENYNYEEDELHINYINWSLQLLVYIGVLAISKVVTLALQFYFPKYLEIAGDYVLAGVAQYPRIELIIVMVIFPFFMNTFVVY